MAILKSYTALRPYPDSYYCANDRWAVILGPDATSLLLNTYAVSRGHYDLSQAATTFRYVVELMGDRADSLHLTPHSAQRCRWNASTVLARRAD